MIYFKKNFLIPVLMIMALTILSADVFASEKVSIGQSVIIEKNEKYDRVVCIGGSLTVYGKVKGEAVAVGGNIDLKPDAEVSGKVVCIGGSINKDPKATVSGKVVNLAFSKVPKTIGQLIAWSVPVLILIMIIKILVLMAFSLVIVLVFPRQIETARTVLDKSALKLGVTGLLVFVCLPIALFLLAVTFIGIPLIPILLLLVFCSILFGKATIALLLGQKLQGTFARKSKSVVSAVIYGELLISLICLIPFIGTLIMLSILLLSLGLCLRTRFGTRGLTVKRKK